MRSASWKSIVGRALLIWLPLAVAVTALTIIVYASVQQVVRLGANDVPAAMAEDAAAQLDAGATAGSLLPAAKVDVARSLSPYLIVFDGQGKLIVSSATVHGPDPSVPAGVFAAARERGEDRVTWQSEPGVRAAIVVVPSQRGFAVAGRSLRLVEQREDVLGHLALALWGLTLAALAVVALALGWLTPNHGPSPARGGGTRAGPNASPFGSAEAPRPTPLSSEERGRG